jgi:hypothetical protein
VPRIVAHFPPRTVPGMSRHVTDVAAAPDASAVRAQRPDRGQTTMVIADDHTVVRLGARIAAAPGLSAGPPDDLSDLVRYALDHKLLET